MHTTTTFLIFFAISIESYMKTTGSLFLQDFEGDPKEGVIDA